MRRRSGIPGRKGMYLQVSHNGREGQAISARQPCATYMQPAAPVFLLNGNKYLNYTNDLISRAKKALPCGEGLGVGVVVRHALRATTTTPTPPASAALRRATLPTRGRVEPSAGRRAAMTDTVHAAFGSASLLSAKAQSSQSVSASTSARSTVEPHQMRKPGGASR